MTTTKTQPAARPSDAPRPWSAGKAVDLVLAAIAHVAVVAAWGLTASALMGLLSIPRRIAMNSEWAFDTGRLPQPWAIAVGVVAVVIAHRLFRAAMRRLAAGPPAYGPWVVALLGLWGGVVLGAYWWQPPVQVGRKVGPASGQFTRWDALGYAAYYARYALPALASAVLAASVLFSRHSPWRAFLAGRRRARRP